METGLRKMKVNELRLQAEIRQVEFRINMQSYSERERERERES